MRPKTAPRRQCGVERVECGRQRVVHGLVAGLGTPALHHALDAGAQCLGEVGGGHAVGSAQRGAIRRKNVP